MLRLARRSLAGIRYFSATAVGEASEVVPPHKAAWKLGGVRGDSLHRRLMHLVYSRRSAVVTIRQWKEEKHRVYKCELIRSVRLLKKLGRNKHALEVCKWMALQQDIKLQEGDYALHLDLIFKLHGINRAEKFFEHLPNKMKGHKTCTALLRGYFLLKDLSKAESVMEKMSECGFLINALPFNYMMSLYISNRQFERVLETLHKLKQHTSPDIGTYNLLLNSYNSQGDIINAEKISLELKKTNLNPDWVTFSLLTSIYIKSSRFEDALLSVREMEKLACYKVRSACSSVITHYAGLGKKEDVDRVWSMMKLSFGKLNNLEYFCMISSLIKLNALEEAEDVYNEWDSNYVTRITRIPNLILAAYIDRNQINMAEMFFEKRIVGKRIFPSYASWDLLTHGYIHEKQMNKAVECLKESIGLVKNGEPNWKTVREVYKMLEEYGNIELAEELLAFLRNAGYVSTELYNLVLKVYFKAGKMPLIVGERMNKDKVLLDDETRQLIKVTSKMCVSEVPVQLW